MDAKVIDGAVIIHMLNQIVAEHGKRKCIVGLHKDGEYFLDIDPKSFEVVLLWLRHRRLVIPSSVDQEAVAVLADFLCLEELRAMVQSPPKPIPSPLDKTLSKLVMVKLCQQGEPISLQLLEPGGQWVCTNQLSGTTAIPYFKLGPVLEDSRGSKADIRLRGSDMVIGLETSLIPRLCLTQGSDNNIWANRWEG